MDNGSDDFWSLLLSSVNSLFTKPVHEIEGKVLWISWLFLCSDIIDHSLRIWDTHKTTFSLFCSLYVPLLQCLTGF